MTDTIEETLDKVMKDETAQTRAVSSLIDVKDRIAGKIGTDIELKTDLTGKETCIHTAVDMIGFFLKVSPDKFDDMDILPTLTNLKERKLLSKGRKSRDEIVNVAKNPDLNMQQAESQGFVRKLFTPKR